MWYGSIMLVQTYCPSWDPPVHRFQWEFSSRS
jgi:hypothetical protein